MNLAEGLPIVSVALIQKLLDRSRVVLCFGALRGHPRQDLYKGSFAIRQGKTKDMAMPSNRLLYTVVTVWCSSARTPSMILALDNK